jgi:hypothetical protein
MPFLKLRFRYTGFSETTFLPSGVLGLSGSPFVTDCDFNALSLYNLAVSDPTYLIQNLVEYFTAVTCLVLTFHCWRLDRQGRASDVTKGSYVALVCMLFLIMAIPSIGL